MAKSSAWPKSSVWTNSSARPKSSSWKKQLIVTQDIIVTQELIVFQTLSVTQASSVTANRVSINVALSDIIYVISGLPHGSALGSVLFLLYINDIDGYIKSLTRLFADDSIIKYRKMYSKADHEILQTYLNQPQT